MVALMKRQPQDITPRDAFDRLDRLFGEWSRLLPMIRMPFDLEPMAGPEEFIRVDEYREDDKLVVRAELPGVDPEQDVEVTVTDHTLHIEAQRREEEETEKKGFLRHELHYGRFSRTLPLPEAVTDTDVAATYKDGILEITVTMPPEETPEEPRRIPVAKS